PKHLAYLRPLLDGESIEMDVYYDPETNTEVNPAIGRIAVLLRKDGVKLRWMSQAASAEVFQMDVDHEADPDEVFGTGQLPLQEKAWNTLKLSAEEGVITVSVADQAVAAFEAALDRRPGVYCEPGKNARVRNVTLSGDWPEEIPEDLFSVGQP
ncbi:MAG: DUF1583 domain-containing protein, partial [Planctomycetota bacterium]